MTGFLFFVAGAYLWAAQAAAVVPLEPQDPDRPKAEIRDFKGLRENNIFSPFRPKKVEASRHEPPPPPPAKPRPRPPVVTGFVFDEKSRVFQVLVEDRNSDVKLKLFAQPRFLQAGEEFLGYAVESVGMQAMSVRLGEKISELRTGDSFPEKAAEAPEKKEAPPSPDGEKVDAPPAEKTEATPSPGDAERNRILEELKKKFKK